MKNKFYFEKKKPPYLNATDANDVEALVKRNVTRLEFRVTIKVIDLSA
ncbi:hypothetical protein [Legionella bozemanae]|nr:hypothetical protein [Legionella bozemanae]